MKKNILILSTSPRKNGNSEMLAREFARGAEEAGHNVELLSLHDKTIGFCKGCLACQKTQRCVIHDDADAIVRKMKDAEVIAFATPIYFYEMCGQMKTLLDRSNPLFGLCVQGHLSAGNGGGQRGEFNGRGRQRLGGLDRLF